MDALFPIHFFSYKFLQLFLIFLLTIHSWSPFTFYFSANHSNHTITYTTYNSSNIYPRCQFKYSQE